MWRTFSNCSILAPHNREVHQLNSLLLDRFDSGSDPKTYFSVDELTEECQNIGCSEKVLNEINQSGLPLHELRLKVGVTVILLRNINPLVGLCNWTRIIITELYYNLIIGKISSADPKFANQRVEIFKCSLRSDENETIRFVRTQFPITIGFALTIHKCQGQTLQRVDLYLKHDVFSHGQLFVGLTRVRSSTAVDIMMSEFF